MNSKSVELKIPSEAGYEKVAMKAGEALAALLHFSPQRVEELKTAISEAVLNSMEHAHKFRKELIVTVLMTVEPDRLQVEVHDQGEGIQAETVDTIPIDEMIAGTQQSRGLGLFLIQRFMDEVEFLHDPLGGSYIRMNVRIGEPNAK